MLTAFSLLGSVLAIGTASAAAPVAAVATAQGSAQSADTIWLSTFSKAFQARTLRNTDAFMTTVSPNGVDVRGLRGAGLTHLSKADLSKDLQDHGSFYQKAFAGPSSSRFVIAPDSTGLVGTILLN